MYQINALNPKEEGHQARKRFGQNFLHDQRVIAKIVRSVNPRTGDNIVEIGPGLAALTSPLIGECDALTVVELDRDLAAGLPGRVPHPERLTIVETDALKYDFTNLFEEGRPLRVVGNLPYNISTPLLFHLLEFGEKIKDMHFMLQKEVVDRITASPNTKEYEPYATKPIVAKDEKALARLVAHVFTQRRKTLRNSLKGMLREDGFEQAGVDPMARPETLSLAQFVALVDQMV